MAIAAAVNPIPSASCVLGRKVIYGSRTSLVEWDVDSDVVSIVATVEGRIEVVTAGVQAGTAWVGTSAGHIYFFDSQGVVLKETLPDSITCISVEDGLMACGCMDGFIYIFKGTKPPRKLQVKGYVLCAAILKNLLVVGGTAWKLFVFDLDSESDAPISLEGHENWVRSLSITGSGSTFTLASASQERYIRLWKFTTEKNPEESVFSTNQKIGEWTVSFEALLMGHDDWVVSVSWDPFGSHSLLSASSDSSLIVWKAEEGDLWTPDTRLGDVSQWGASTATGTSGGFWAGLWMSDRVLTATITGSWRVWLRPESGNIYPNPRTISTHAEAVANDDSESPNRDTADADADADVLLDWQAVPGLSGHLKDVTDVAWLTADLFFTTSLDQTTRLWYVAPSSSPTKNEEKSTSSYSGAPRLVEVGRPQIHGYDMITLVPVSSQLFVSAGDEKVMRVFELPRQVAAQIQRLNSADSLTLTIAGASSVTAGGNEEEQQQQQQQQQQQLHDLPDTAAVPVLGLSNKADKDDIVEDLPAVPSEVELQKHTLWPEIDKLYGHGYEVCAIAYSPQQKVLVSCCKANSEQHARLRFCSSETWLETGEPVSGHALTVTGLRVSPDGTKVLSVSRDRKYMLTDVSTRQVLVDQPKAHSRIIWDGCFVDNERFITVSRDKTAKVWDTATLKSTTPLSSPGTAVDFRNGKVVIGEETGKVVVYRYDSSSSSSSHELREETQFRVPGRVNSVEINKNGSAVAIASDIVSVFAI